MFLVEVIKKVGMYLIQDLWKRDSGQCLYVHQYYSLLHMPWWITSPLKHHDLHIKINVAFQTPHESQEPGLLVLVEHELIQKLEHVCLYVV